MAESLTNNQYENQEKIEGKEREEVERRSCTIIDVYEYPIFGPRGERKTGCGVILKPDELKGQESKDFTISTTLDDANHPEFKVGQKVWHITSKRERPATEKTDWKDEILPKDARRVSGGYVNLPKEVVVHIVNPVTNPTNKNLINDLITEQKEGEKIERRLCTVKKVYHYPIIGKGKKIRGYGIILKPDELKSNEHKDFTISYVYDDRDHPKFRDGEKVWYINNGMKTEIVKRNRKK